MKKITTLLLLALLAGLAFQATPARASTLAEIQTSIDDGLAYLAGIQNVDGSWTGDFPVGITCIAVSKFQDRAYEKGYASPWDPAYTYSDEITKAYQYIFANAHTQTPLAVQTAGDPDTNGNGYGVWFASPASAPGYSEVNYETGLCLMAMHSSKLPSHPNEGNLDFDGDLSPDTFGELSQEGVDFLAWSQNDTGVNRGGWRYGFNPQDADGSVTGFVTLGLAYAEAFGATIPAFVKTELDNWITYSQCADGGAAYTACPTTNLYRTGHLITMMAFVGDTPATPRMDNALAYIETNWGLPLFDGTGFLGTWSLMKGLSYSGVHLLDLDGDTVRDEDWYNEDPGTSYDLATYTIGLQQVDGGWGAGNFYEGNSAALKAAFALLILEKASPPPPNTPPVAVDDSYATNMSVAFTGATVLANDTDGDSDPLTAALVTGPANASDFTFNADGTFYYEPANGFKGTDTFTYMANDGTADSNVATVSIDVTPLTMTFYSLNTLDGWVSESAEGSGKGGSFIANGILRLGDTALNQQYRSFLSFNASAMPANAVIVDARVRIKYFDIRGVDPATTHGALVADVRTGFFGSSQALAAEDFNAPASKVRLGVFRQSPNPIWWNMLIRPADYHYVNTGGITQFRLRFELRTNGDNIEDWIRFASGNNVTATQPRMIVAYYIPHP